MNKLSYFSGVKYVPSLWQNCHVEEIYNYLCSRGYKFKLFKQFDSSNYILSLKNHVSYYNSCKEFCIDFIDLYFKEKEEEEKEFFRRRNELALKEKILIKGVLSYEKN